MRPSRQQRIIVIAAAMVLAGCGAPTDVGPRDNEVARQRWLAERPASYDYTLAITCFCPDDLTRPVVIVVNGTNVVSRRYGDTGASVSERFTSSFPSIDGLFATIDSANAKHASKVEVTYDAVRGFPTRIAIDYIALAIDDEITYTIRDFHAR